MVMAFVHPAAVVPLVVGPLAARGWMRRVDGAALVAGSVGPDVADYFVRMSARPALHGEPLWLLTSGLAGALGLFACVVVAGPGVARALPPFFAARFGPSLSRPWRERKAAHVVLSLLVGLVTHVAWDALTERHGLAQVFAPGVVPWRALYVPTTVAGILALGAGIALAPRVTSSSGALDARALVAVVTSSLAFAAAFAGVRHRLLEGTVPDAMAAASAGAIVGVVVAGVFSRVRAGRRAKEADAGV
jgi:hypothetical protein